MSRGRRVAASRTAGKLPPVRGYPSYGSLMRRLESRFFNACRSRILAAMRSIAMINQKGGVGKTTTAVNVAAGLARWGARVLLVDLDPQSHASLYLGVQAAPEEIGAFHLLLDGAAAEKALRPIGDRLALIAAHVDLVAAEAELANRPRRELTLRRALDPIADRFDFIIIDCPPSLGLLTVNALAAVREVMIPLQTHFLALQGLGMLLHTATAVRDMVNPELRITGVILCMYEKGTRLAQEVESDVRQFIAAAAPTDAWHGARVFDTTIRRNIKLAECPSFGKTIFDYAADSHGAEDYGSLARELLEMRHAAAPTSAAAKAGESPKIVAQAEMDATEVVPTASAAPPPFEEPLNPAAPERRGVAGASCEIAESDQITEPGEVPEPAN